MGHCVALRHVWFEGLDLLAGPLDRLGWRTTVAGVRRPEDIPAAADTADLLVVLGGPDGVYESHPYLDREIELVRGRLAGDRPVLGICLGSQVLAEALGATVRRAPHKEIGWYPITPSPEAAGDPLAAEFTAGTPLTLHWHGDTFDLPPGTVPLARSAVTACQGFRYRDHTYALQFHPEVSAERLPAWIEGYRDELSATPEAQPPEDMLRTAAEIGPAVRARTERFMEGYLRRLEAARPEVPR